MFLNLSIFEPHVLNFLGYVHKGRPQSSRRGFVQCGHFAEKGGWRLSQCGQFADKGGKINFSRFCADVLYERPLIIIVLIKHSNIKIS